jgi:LPXTG-motif cell wall-anchored protein
MRLGRIMVGSGFFGVVLALAPMGVAQAAPCTGNTVIQQAPYTCEGTHTDGGITVNLVLSVDAIGRAVADFTLTAVQTVDVPIAMHSWIGIDTGPDIVETGSIPAGSTTSQLVIEEIRCGQLDVKAVNITPGVPAGEIVGPYITWGVDCQQVPTTTTTTATTTPTTVPTTAATTTTTPVVPTSISPTTIPRTTLPNTGTDVTTPGTWAIAAVVLGGVLVLLARRWRGDSAT